jgi:tetratricopeptide (TPR) repeat protein
MGLRPWNEGFRLAREAANRALAIAPEHAEAFAQLGFIAQTYDGDLTTAARYFERALALEPTNPGIIGDAAFFLQRLGRLDEAIALSEYVVARDPLDPSMHAGLGHAYNRAGRLDDAIASWRTALSLSPGQNAAQLGIGLALVMNGEPEAALVALAEEDDYGWRLTGSSMAYHARGRAAESDSALAELIEKGEQGWPYQIAYVLAYRGEADRAFEWLDKAVEYNDGGLGGISPDAHLFANIHDDPRWLPFLENIGRSAEDMERRAGELAAIEFEVTLPQ